MADNSNILSEFLVALGFKVDKASETHFKESVKAATDAMKEFGVAMTAAATQSLIVLNRMAENLGALHYQSQRVGASVNSIKALQFAFQQVGGSAEGASTALETIATRLRESPAWEGKLNGMGIATRDAAGNMRDSAEMLLDFGKKLADMPDYRAMSEGSTLGLDERTTLALRNSATAQAYQDQIDMQQKLGVNLDESAAKANKYNQEMSSLKTTLSALIDQTAGDLTGELVPALEAANSKLKEFADWYKDLTPQQKEFAKSTAEVATGLTAIVGGLAAMKAAKGVLGMLLGRGKGGGIGGAIGKDGVVPVFVTNMSGSGLPGDGNPIPDPAKGKKTPPIPPTTAETEAQLATKAAPVVAEAGFGWLSRLAPAIYALVHSDSLNAGENEFVKQQAQERAKKKSQPAKAPAASTPTAPVASGYTMPLWLRGVSDLVGRGEGDYSSINLGKAGGYKASKANLAGMTLDEVMQAQRDHKFNAAGRYQIIKGTLVDAKKSLGLNGNEKFDQHLQDRIFAEYLIGKKRKDVLDFIQKKLGNTKDTSLSMAKEWASFADPRTGKSFHTGVGNNAASIPYAVLAPTLLEAQRSYQQSVAANGPTISQTNNITVNGVSQPQETAKAVAMAQNDVYALMTRNAQPKAF